MQTIVPIIYDVATLVLIISMAASSASRGFARTAVSLVGYLAALFGAAACASPLASGVYNGLIQPRVVGGIEEKLREVQPDLVPQALLEIVESFPPFLFQAAGLDQQQMVQTLSELVENSGANAAQSIAAAIVAPLAILLLKAVFFLLIFGVAMFFVHKLAWVFGGVNRLPVLGPVNRIFGFVFGLAEAALTVYVFILLLDVVLTFTGGQLQIHVGGEELVIAGDAVTQRTYLFGAFARFNPVDWLLKWNFSDMTREFSSAGRAFV